MLGFDGFGGPRPPKKPFLNFAEGLFLMVLGPLGSHFGGRRRCWRIKLAFSEKVLLARTGARKWWSRRVLGGSWIDLGTYWGRLEASWTALGVVFRPLGALSEASGSLLGRP